MIKLTQFHNVRIPDMFTIHGQTIYVNFSHIIMMYRCDRRVMTDSKTPIMERPIEPCTELVFLKDDVSVFVIETPEEIIKMKDGV